MDILLPGIEGLRNLGRVLPKTTFFVIFRLASEILTAPSWMYSSEICVGVRSTISWKLFLLLTIYRKKIRFVQLWTIILNINISQISYLFLW